MDYVTRQFINLTKKFRKELRKYQDTLHHDFTHLSDGFTNLKKSIDAHQQADSKRSQVQPSIAISDLRTEIPVSVKTYAQRSPIESIWRVVKGILEIAVAIAVVGYTAISWENWQEQIDATNFAGIQAKKARQSLNETIKNFRIDERAWVVPSFPPDTLPDNRPAWMPFNLVNSGKTPAKRIYGRVALKLFSQSDTVVLTDLRDGYAISRGMLFPGAPDNFHFGLGEHPAGANFTGLMWNRTLRENLNNGTKFVLGFGKLTYYDIFGGEHILTFCRLLEGGFTVKPGEKPIPDIERRCIEFNGEADK